MEETVRMYPNPVTDHAVFEIPVEGQGRIRIEVMNSLGAVISVLEESTLGPGNHLFFWDACDASGGRLESGFYIYRISVGSTLFSGKFLLR
jgi:flagellar hook assembly protein FlgD